MEIELLIGTFMTVMVATSAACAYWFSEQHRD